MFNRSPHLPLHMAEFAHQSRITLTVAVQCISQGMVNLIIQHSSHVRCSKMFLSTNLLPTVSTNTITEDHLWVKKKSSMSSLPSQCHFDGVPPGQGLVWLQACSRAHRGSQHQWEHSSPASTDFRHFLMSIYDGCCPPLSGRCVCSSPPSAPQRKPSRQGICSRPPKGSKIHNIICH